MAKRHPKPNRRQAAVQQLHAAFPLAFPLDDADLRPLAISSRDDLVAWIAGQAFDERTGRALLSALHHHCSRATYQRTVGGGNDAHQPRG